MSNLPQTASDLFDNLLPLGVLAYPERVREIGGVFLFKITGDGGGVWALDCTSTPPRVLKGPETTAGAAGVTIELEHEDFKKLLTNHNYGIDLYFASKLRIQGDSALAMKLGVFFEITRPNPG